MNPIKLLVIVPDEETVLTCCKALVEQIKAPASMPVQVLTKIPDPVSNINCENGIVICVITNGAAEGVRLDHFHFVAHLLNWNGLQVNVVKNSLGLISVRHERVNPDFSNLVEVMDCAHLNRIMLDSTNISLD